MSRRTKLAAVGVGCALVACGLFPDLGDLTDGGTDAQIDAQIDAPIDAPLADGGSDAADASTQKCSGDGGPIAIAASGFCIDSTEVTNAQYAAFIATNPSLASLPPQCIAWKTKLTQGVTPPPGTEDYPAVNLDWCDAYAFCQWAGKRLCGRIDGGALAVGGMNDIAQDAWYVACSNNGATTYPYGGPFDASVCNGPERGASSVLPSSSMPSCIGGFSGLSQMVGNADEWIDSCKTASNGPDAAFDTCERRSGSFSNPDGSVATCMFARPGSRQQEDDDIGFRCCSSLAP